MAEIIEEKSLRNKDYVFRDRAHAGELLARKLGPYVEPGSIVLAIPSGGVPVGKIIANELGLPLDLIIVRKLPVHFNTEAGFGSMSWDGEVMLNERLVKHLQLSKEEISSAIEEVKHELERRIERFRGKRPFPELKGMTVIIVDDGLASGYTMLAAISSIKKRSCARIMVAIPRASKNAIELVSPYVDEIFCLNVRETAIFAVADAYQEWHDLTEQEVLELLKK
ncbi:MAG: phosphoribosyltransferase [Euryarchaeota archaeon]|nr:phosphoribosyltransferase [Euryarchaeota archaeon]MBU4139948.1 phosphoribosyltransferase [Euryarchaeota archaeon]